MDGTAAAGSSALYARGDHVHPRDTSRLALAGGTLTGALTLAADPTANLQAATKAYVDAGVATAEVNVAGGFVNKLRNGTFDVWQRGTGIFSVTSGVYTADGWIVGAVGGTSSVSAQAAPAGRLARNIMQMGGAAGMAQLLLTQRVESYVSAPLTNQRCTFQAQILNATPAALTPTLSISTANPVDNFASPVTVLAPVNLQSCASGQWTRVAYTFDMGANPGLGVQVQLNFGALTVNSVSIAEADLRATPGVATGLNANPPPPELRPIAIELAFCRRYFQRRQPGIASAQLSTSGGATSVNAAATFFQLEPMMRATPTFTSGGNLQIWGIQSSGAGGATAPISGLGASTPSPIIYQVNFNLSSSLASACHVAALRDVDGTGWVAFSAEL